MIYICVKKRTATRKRGRKKMQLKFNKNGRLVTISAPSGVGVVYAPTKAEMRKKVAAMVAHMIEREIGKNETYFIP